MALLKKNEEAIHTFRREGSRITEEELADILGPGEFENLLGNKVLKRDSKGTKIEFVGILIRRHEEVTSTLVCYPKYLPEEWSSGGYDDPLDYTGLVLRSLEAYSRSGNVKLEEEEDIFLPSTLQEAGGNELALARFFIRDYLMDGPFRYEKVTTSINSSANVDWNRTLQYSEPVMTRSGPIYTELVTKRRRIVEDDLISNYHRLVVGEFIRKYGRVLGYPNLMPEMVGDVPNRERLEGMRERGRDSLLWYELSKRLKSSYASRAIRLLKNLLNSIEPQYVDESGTMIMGTRNFKALWEEACRNYLDPAGHNTTEYNRYLETPVWETLERETIAKTGGSQQMDVVSIPSGSRLMIADAKYYHLDYQDDPPEIRGTAPGVGDILKQWAYKEIIARVPGIEREDIANILLFPHHGSGPREHLVWPFATVDNQLMDGTDPVVSCFVDAEEALDLYARGVVAEPSELDGIYDCVLI